MLTLLLQRRMWFRCGLGWSVLSLVMAAWIASRIDLGDDLIDKQYHAHMSGILGGVLTGLVLFLLLREVIQQARFLSVAEQFSALARSHLFAVVGGTGLAYGIGWVKEIFDATQGRFIDTADVQANVGALLTYAGSALLLALPILGLVALVGDPLRCLLLGSGGARHKQSQQKLKMAEQDLHKNQKYLHRAKALTKANQNETLRLLHLYEGLSPERRDSEEGERLRAKLEAAREANRKLELITQRLSQENARLRDALMKLDHELPPDAPGLRDEVHALLDRCTWQAERTAIARESQLVTNAHFDIGAPALKTVESSSEQPTTSESPSFAVAPPSLSPDVDAHANEPPPAATAPLSLNHLDTLIDAATPEALDASPASAAASEPVAPSSAPEQANTPEPEDDALPASVGELRQTVRALQYESARRETQAIRNAKHIAKLEEDLRAARAAAAEVRATRRRVLLVDSDSAWANRLAGALTESGLFEVAIFLDGESALTYLKSATTIPEALLLEPKLPDQPGGEFVRTIVEHRWWRSMRLVICSTTRAEDWPDSLRDQAWDVWPKPMSLTHAVQRLKTVAGLP